MKPWVPAPWAHLTMQQDLFYAALRERTTSRDQADQLQWVYETLNRVTAPQLLRAVRQAGFEVAREYRTYDEMPVPEELKEIYTEDVLTTNQLVFLARHAVPATACGLEEGIPRLLRSSKPAHMETDVARAQTEAAMLPAPLAHETAGPSEAQRADLLQRYAVWRAAAGNHVCPSEAQRADLWQRYEELRTSLDAAQANLVLARADIAQLDQALATMRASRSWRVTQPLRMVQHRVRKVFRFLDALMRRTDAKQHGPE
jgi:hypothetical protein